MSSFVKILKSGEDFTYKQQGYYNNSSFIRKFTQLPPFKFKSDTPPSLFKIFKFEDQKGENKIYEISLDINDLILEGSTYYYLGNIEGISEGIYCYNIDGRNSDLFYINSQAVIKFILTDQNLNKVSGVTITIGNKSAVTDVNGEASLYFNKALLRQYNLTGDIIPVIGNVYTDISKVIELDVVAFSGNNIEIEIFGINADIYIDDSLANLYNIDWDDSTIEPLPLQTTLNHVYGEASGKFAKILSSVGNFLSFTILRMLNTDVRSFNNLDESSASLLELTIENSNVQTLDISTFVVLETISLANGSVLTSFTLPNGNNPFTIYDFRNCDLTTLDCKSRFSNRNFADNAIDISNNINLTTLTYTNEFAPVQASNLGGNIKANGCNISDISTIDLSHQLIAINIDVSDNSMNSTDVDNAIIHASTNFNIDPLENNILKIDGNNGNRTSVSDSALLDLQSKNVDVKFNFALAGDFVQFTTDQSTLQQVSIIIDAITAYAPSTATGVFYIDWGDGSNDLITRYTGQIDKNYGSTGIYDIKIYASDGNLDDMNYLKISSANITAVTNLGLLDKIRGLILNDNSISSTIDLSLFEDLSFLELQDNSITGVTFPVLNDGQRKGYVNEFLFNVGQNSITGTLDISNQEEIIAQFANNTGLTGLTLNPIYSNTGISFIQCILFAENCNLSGSVNLNNYIGYSIGGSNNYFKGNSSMTDLVCSNANLTNNQMRIDINISGTGITSISNIDLQHIDTYIAFEAKDIGLNSTQVDNMLIHADTNFNFTTTNDVGGFFGVIDLSGTNAARTSASDAAVTSLLTKGVNVITN